MNSKIGELPEPEKEAVWRRIQNILKRKSQHRPKSHPAGNSQRSRRNSDRSEVSVVVVVVVDSHIQRIVLVCVCFLPIHSGHQVRWTYQPGSHRRKVTQDF